MSLPPASRFVYSLSTLLFLWQFPVQVNILRVLMSMFCISSLVQSRIPNVKVNTGTANILCAITLFRLYNSDFQIFRTRLKYSFLTRSLFRSPLQLMSSSHPKYLYESFSTTSVSSKPFTCLVSPRVFLWPRSMQRYLHVWYLQGFSFGLVLCRGIYMSGISKGFPLASFYVEVFTCLVSPRVFLWPRSMQRYLHVWYLQGFSFGLVLCRGIYMSGISKGFPLASFYVEVFTCLVSPRVFLWPRSMQRYLHVWYLQGFSFGLVLCRGIYMYGISKGFPLASFYVEVFTCMVSPRVFLWPRSMQRYLHVWYLQGFSFGFPLASFYVEVFTCLVSPRVFLWPRSMQRYLHVWYLQGFSFGLVLCRGIYMSGISKGFPLASFYVEVFTCMVSPRVFLWPRSMQRYLHVWYLQGFSFGLVLCRGIYMYGISKGFPLASFYVEVFTCLVSPRVFLWPRSMQRYLHVWYLQGFSFGLVLCRGIYMYGISKGFPLVSFYVEVFTCMVSPRVFLWPRSMQRYLHVWYLQGFSFGLVLCRGIYMYGISKGFPLASFYVEVFTCMVSPRVFLWPRSMQRYLHVWYLQGFSYVEVFTFGISSSFYVEVFTCMVSPRVFLWPRPMQRYARLSPPKVIPMSLVNFVMTCSCFSAVSLFGTYVLRSSTNMQVVNFCCACIRWSC